MELQGALLLLLSLAAVVALLIWLARYILRRRARKLGYQTLTEYLRAVPATNAEKLDALDLAMKGVVITLLGIIFPPLIVVGLIPLYFGLRKISSTLMGLGLTETAPG